MDKIRVRVANKKDALNIAKVHFYSSNALYYELFETNPTETFNIESRTRYWKNVIPGSISEAKSKIILVAELPDKTLVGFISISLGKLNEGTREAHLDSIYIYSTFHRHGVGTMLFQRAKKQVQELGATSLHVWVLEKNPACHFYKRLGGKNEVSSANPLKIGGHRTKEIAYSWTLSQEAKKESYLDNELSFVTFSTNINDFYD